MLLLYLGMKLTSEFVYNENDPANKHFLHIAEDSLISLGEKFVR